MICLASGQWCRHSVLTVPTHDGHDDASGYGGGARGGDHGGCGCGAAVSLFMICGRWVMSDS